MSNAKKPIPLEHFVMIDGVLHRVTPVETTTVQPQQQTQTPTPSPERWGAGASTVGTKPRRPSARAQKEVHPADMSPALAAFRQLMDSKEAAAYIGVSDVYFRIKRGKGEGPAYQKFGGKYGYRKEDLDAFLALKAAGGGAGATSKVKPKRGGKK